jgi:hypothetical protein
LTPQLFCLHHLLSGPAPVKAAAIDGSAAVTAATRVVKPAETATSTMFGCAETTAAVLNRTAKTDRNIFDVLLDGYEKKMIWIYKEH